jgi:hypothetical protein
MQRRALAAERNVDDFEHNGSSVQRVAPPFRASSVERAVPRFVKPSATRAP